MVRVQWKLLRALFDSFPTGSMPVAPRFGIAGGDHHDMVGALGDGMVTLGAAIFLHCFIGLYIANLVGFIWFGGTCNLGSASHFATVLTRTQLIGDSEALWKR